MAAIPHDYYEILGVEREAGIERIRQAFRREALLWHPDKNPHRLGEAERRFKLLSEAYETLSDPAKREAYDGGAMDIDMNTPHASYQHAQHIFREFFGMHFPFGVSAFSRGSMDDALFFAPFDDEDQDEWGEQMLFFRPAPQVFQRTRRFAPAWSVADRAPREQASTSQHGAGTNRRLGPAGWTATTRGGAMGEPLLSASGPSVDSETAFSASLFSSRRPGQSTAASTKTSITFGGSVGTRSTTTTTHTINGVRTMTQVVVDADGNTTTITEGPGGERRVTVNGVGRAGGPSASVPRLPDRRHRM